MAITRKKIICGALSFAIIPFISNTATYANDTDSTSSDLNTYSLENTIIYGNRDKKIHNPYITGGDETIINRKDIENHNYSDIEEALRTIPGVQISTPGYKGGEYGYSSYNTELTINGENNIVILVDGRRVDNDANSYAGNKSRVNLSTLPGIDNVEQIEVIKGAGSIIYGSDIAGGVINIITRKGTAKSKTTLDVATGSWKRHNYAITHTGSSKDKTLKYAVSYSKQLSGDSKYKDATTGTTQTYDNTGYRNENAAVNITKDFNKTHSLNITYNHSYQKAYYPITAPDLRYIDSFYAGTMTSVNPSTGKYIGLSSAVDGYRNIFLYDAWLGSYDETQTNNIDVKYVFDKTDKNAESFIRIYKNYTRYNTMDYCNIWNVAYPYLYLYTDEATDSPNAHTDIEKVTGTTMQIAKHIKNHNLVTGMDIRKSEYEGWDSSSTYNSERNSYRIYLQDKIDASKKFTITPGINYSYYSNGDYNDTHFSSTNKITFSIYNKYNFDDKTNMYFSASQIFKPVTGIDYHRSISTDPLKNEEGYNYNIGISRKISDNDKLNVNYSTVNMSNAIARYSVLNTSESEWVKKSVNAKRKKKALNVSYNHKFNDSWTLGTSYSWVNETFHTKNVQHNPDGTTADDLINAYRPRNIYRIHLSYEKNKWFNDLAYTIYSGNDTNYFTSSHFGVLDLALNYKLNKSTQVYFKMNNILNKAYETRALSTYNAGALPEAGRNFMLGVRYTF